MNQVTARGLAWAPEWPPVSRARRAELHRMPPVTAANVSPVLAIAAGFFLRDWAVSLIDLCELTLMLGLGAPPLGRPAPDPQRQIRPDAFRRGRKRRK